MGMHLTSPLVRVGKPKPIGCMPIAAWNLRRSVLPRVDEVADDGRLAERLGGFQAVQALDQHEAGTVGAHQDRRLLAGFEHAGGDFVHAFLLKRGTPFDRHVDVGDGDGLALHHGEEEDSIGSFAKTM